MSRGFPSRCGRAPGTVYQELQDVQAAVLAIDNLTDSQKAELREALRDTQADLSAVLTDEQLAEL